MIGEAAVQGPGATGFETTLAALFEAAAAAAPGRVLLSFAGEEITLAAMADRAGALAAGLAAGGVGCGGRVATLMGNHPDHVAMILALARLGAVWIPLDSRLPPAALAPRLALVRPRVAIADPGWRATLAAAGFAGPVAAPGELAAAGPPPRPPEPGPDDWRTILFTSGTTGAPKGVIVTERMLVAAACFANRVSRADAGQTFLLWEPLNHIGGAQMIPAALTSGARLALVERFSASLFWDQARAAGATRIHYLGGVLDLLAKQPPGPQDRAHGVTLGFGAAARPEMWRLFPERFGVRLVEVYGQTEAASFCVANVDGVPGSIGRPLTEFEIALAGPDGRRELGPGAAGEMALRADPPGLITPGYLDAPEATAAAFRDGWFLTGDLARRDGDGNLYFLGRTREAIRRRGENVSALEVETAIAAHPAIEECAVIGVPAEIGEEEILALVTLAPGAAFRPAELRRWLADRLAPFQMPRYVRVVAAFPRTASERIAKSALPRDTAGAWDAEAASL